VTGVEGIEGMHLRLRRIDAIRGGLRMVHSLYGLDFLINKIAEGIVDNAEWLKG
jgi:hypothetical protein